METALDAFEIDNGRYPTTEEGLPALIEQPGQCQELEGAVPEARRAERSLGQRLSVCLARQRTPRAATTCYSYGPDGQEGGGDDIDNWTRRSNTTGCE